MKCPLSYINLLLVAIFVIGLTSCEQEYKIEDIDFEKKLVVNTHFTHNQPWSVSVTHSVNALDNEEIGAVTDAKVEIYNREGNYLYDLHLDAKGRYSNEEKAPSYGAEYNIVVSAAGFKTVYANDKVPLKGELKYNFFDVLDMDGNFVKKDISFFIGKPDDDTYLVWELYNKSEIGEDGIPEIERTLTNSWLRELANNPKSVLTQSGSKVGKTLSGNTTTSLDELIVIDQNNSNLNTEISTIGGISNLSSDEDFFLPNLTSDEKAGENSTGGNIREYTYELRVMTISKELHDYYQSVADYYEFNNNSLIVPPSKVHTNVTNGFGIFGSFHEQVIRF